MPPFFQNHKRTINIRKLEFPSLEARITASQHVGYRDMKPVEPEVQMAVNDSR
jgi:hypothetical protein